MRYLQDFLEKQSGKEGNHWDKFNNIMNNVQEYEKEFGIKILVLVEDNQVG